MAEGRKEGQLAIDVGKILASARVDLDGRLRCGRLAVDTPTLPSRRGSLAPKAVERRPKHRAAEPGIEAFLGVDRPEAAGDTHHRFVDAVEE